MSLMWSVWALFNLSLQVYQMNTGQYLCRNKYYGRGLSIEGFRQALYQYMHNGNGLRQDLFEPILNKLRSLKAVLERQASYRFYSSSLLIIYEGQVSRLKFVSWCQNKSAVMWWCAFQLNQVWQDYFIIQWTPVRWHNFVMFCIHSSECSL